MAVGRAVGRVKAAPSSFLLTCQCLLFLLLRNQYIRTAKLHDYIECTVSLGSLRENPQRNGHVLFSQSSCVRHLRNLASATERMKKRVFAQSRILYYSNHSAVFNIELICSHGDIHPHPGPSHVIYRNHDGDVAYGNRHCRSDISIFYANSRGLVNKTALLELEIATYRYDIMVFTETHLDSTITDSELFPSNYTVFRRDRSYNGRKGGGVLIATRDTVKVSQREDLLCDSELLFVDIHVSGNRKVNLGVFYRPPKSDINPLLDLQTALDNVLSTPNSDLLLLGDFNMPEINWETNCVSRSSDHTTLLCEIIHDNFLTQLVKVPTREDNILDLVLVSSLDLVHDLTVGQPFSDHNSINLFLSRSSQVYRRSEKLVYSFRKADWEHLQNLLSYTPWHCAFLEDNIDLVWSAWSDLLLSAVDECIPKKKSRDPQTHHGLIAISSNSAVKRNYSIRGLKNHGRSPTGSIIVS